MGSALASLGSAADFKSSQDSPLTAVFAAFRLSPRARYSYCEDAEATARHEYHGEADCRTLDRSRKPIQWQARTRLPWSVADAAVRRVERLEPLPYRERSAAPSPRSLNSTIGQSETVPLKADTTVLPRGGDRRLGRQNEHEPLAIAADVTSWCRDRPVHRRTHETTLSVSPPAHCPTSRCPPRSP